MTTASMVMADPWEDEPAAFDALEPENDPDAEPLADHEAPAGWPAFDRMEW